MLGQGSDTTDSEAGTSPIEVGVQSVNSDFLLHQAVSLYTVNLHNYITLFQCSVTVSSFVVVLASEPHCPCFSLF